MTKAWVRIRVSSCRKHKLEFWVDVISSLKTKKKIIQCFSTLRMLWIQNLYNCVFFLPGLVQTADISGRRHLEGGKVRFYAPQYHYCNGIQLVLSSSINQNYLFDRGFLATFCCCQRPISQSKKLGRILMKYFLRLCENQTSKGPSIFSE